MREFGRMCRAELWKMRRSGLYPIHVFCPVIAGTAALLYFISSGWDAYERSSLYIQLLGIAYPLVISIVCAKNTELEERGHFQTMLGMRAGRLKVLAAKWLTMEGCILASLLLAVGILSAGELFFWHQTAAAFRDLRMGAVLWGFGAVLCLEHLCLNLLFSKAVSMGISVVQLLLSALFLTGIGDGRWQWLPGTWSAAGSARYLQLLWEQADGKAGAFVTQMGACLLSGGAICAIIIVWFLHYEVRTKGQ